MKQDNAIVDPMVAPAMSDGTVQATLLESLQPVFEVHGPSPAYYQRFFQLCVDRFQPLAASLDVRIRVEVASHQHLDPSVVDPSEQAELADQLETCSTQVLLDENAQPHGLSASVGGRDVCVIGVGLQDLVSGEVRGSLVVAVAASGLDDEGTLRHALSMFCAVAMSLERSAQQETARAPDVTPDWQRALQKSGGYRSARELAFTLANSLANKFQCEHVGIGVVRRRRSEVLAISGLASFKASSPGVVEMRAAMDECQDFGRLIIVQPSGDPETSENLPLHRQWSRSAGDTPVCSIPLLVDNECVAVASLRFSADRVLTKQELERFAANVMPFAQAFRMLHLAGRTLRTHVADTLRDQACQWVRPQTTGGRALIAAVLVAFGWFLFGFLPYKPLCTAQLVPRQLRHVSAPFEGQLEHVHVQAGDRVKAGQPLLEFDVHALQLELSALRAEIAASEVGLRNALDKSDASAAALARADLDVFRSKAVAVQDRIDKAIIVAPSDGMVMQCNLRQHVGATLARGDALLQFAPRHGWDVEIHVPDAVAPFVTLEQRGTFATASHPGQTFPFQIRQVSGSAEIQGGKNIFVADAPLEGDMPWMRSGMEGVAQIKTVWKPVWWVTLHSVVDNLRLKFWM